MDWTALHRAARRGDAGAVQELLKSSPQDVCTRATYVRHVCVEIKHGAHESLSFTCKEAGTYP